MEGAVGPIAEWIDAMPSSRVHLFTSAPGVLSQIFVTAQAPCGPQLSAVRAATAERDGATALTPSPAAQHWPPPPSQQGSPPLPSRVLPSQALATSASGLCSQEGRHHYLLLLGTWLLSASFFPAPCSTCPPPMGPGPPPHTPCIAARAWGTVHSASRRPPSVFVLFRRMFAG